MMTNELQKKVYQSLRLLDSAQRQAKDGQIEVSYSGGKDSDVILELAKMAGINARPIYKNTTIDPPGTISHCQKKGVEIVRPKYGFGELIQRKGYPNRLRRFCCSVLKEYKILDYSVQGIRRSESVKRSERYKEPQICRVYDDKSRVSVFLPILEWTDKDVAEFVAERGIECHPLYYDEHGQFCVRRRLGCMGCPMLSDNGLADFKRRPLLAKMWLRNGQKWWDEHEIVKTKAKFRTHYDVFVRNVFFNNYEDFRTATSNIFGEFDCKAFLERYFNINLDF